MTILHSQTKNLLKGLLFLLICMGMALAEAQAKAPSKFPSEKGGGGWGFNITRPIGVPGEDSFLVSSMQAIDAKGTRRSYLIQIRCEEGYKANGVPIRIHEVNIFEAPQGAESLKPEQLSILNEPGKFRQIDRVPLASVEACFALRGECSLEKTHVLMLTGGRSGKYKHQCTPKSVPPSAPKRPGSAT